MLLLLSLMYVCPKNLESPPVSAGADYSTKRQMTHRDASTNTAQTEVQLTLLGRYAGRLSSGKQGTNRTQEPEYRVPDL